jgi:hypothetical protein
MIWVVGVRRRRRLWPAVHASGPRGACLLASCAHRRVYSSPARTCLCIGGSASEASPGFATVLRRLSCAGLRVLALLQDVPIAWSSPCLLWTTYLLTDICCGQKVVRRSIFAQPPSCDACVCVLGAARRRVSRVRGPRPPADSGCAPFAALLCAVGGSM